MPKGLTTIIEVGGGWWVVVTIIKNYINFLSTNKVQQS